MTEHVSDLQLDRMLADEPVDAAAREHAESCARCVARMRELTAERDAFVLSGPPLPAHRPRVRWLVPGAAAVALAAALLLWLRGGDREPTTRIKGEGPSLELVVEHDARIVALGAGEPVHPGDRVQAIYSSTRDGFGAVLSIDGAGTISAYVPSQDAVLVALPAGSRRTFPQSTILDGVLGRERIQLVWCEDARPLAPLLDELRATGSLSPRPGCTIRAVEVVKR